MTDNWIEQAINYSLAQIRQNLARLKGFPERTEEGRWVCVEKIGEKPGWWVGGHWVGQIWLTFAYTQESSPGRCCPLLGILSSPPPVRHEYP